YDISLHRVFALEAPLQNDNTNYGSASGQAGLALPGKEPHATVPRYLEQKGRTRHMVEFDAGFVEAIRSAVQARREDAVSLLRELVRVPSVTGEEGAVGAVVERAFSERGLDVDTWEATREETEPYREHIGEQSSYENRPNVAGTKRGTGDGRSILLNAHTDTVDPGDPTAWKGDPLSGNLEGDLLYGRGSCDMKGGLVTYLVALDALSTVLRGYRADAAIITEPTRLALVPAQGGSLVFRLKIPGRSAHAAVRDEGVSALEKFVPIFENLRELEQERNGVLSHPLYDAVRNKVPINIGVVRAGNWASTVPESLVAEGRVGLIPGEEVDPFKDLVSGRISAVAERDSWLREHPPELRWFGGQFAPAEVPTDAPICEAVKRAHEHISVPDLLTATETIACLLADWCGMEG